MGRVLTIVAVLALLVVIGVLVRVGMGGSGEGPPALEGDDERSLEAIRTELSRAEPVSRRTDAERLAEARGWIAANRPEGWAYADLESWMLAQYEAMGEAEPRSARWAMRAARGEFEMVRALDADGDGAVSDEEVEAFAAVLSELQSPETHPYLVERFDTDGDGVLSPEEAAWWGGEAQMAQLEGLIERGRIDKWDTDGDGVLSESERDEGAALALRHSRMFEDGHIEHVENPGEDEEAEQALVYERIVEQFGEEAAQMTLDRRGRAAEYNLSAGLSRAMRLFESDVPLPDDAPPMPQPPDVGPYDTDGDGALDDRDGYMAELGAYQLEFAEWNSLTQAMRLRATFDAVLADGDVNGDGRLLADEWRGRTDALVAERDERLFLMHYDTDGSGQVGARELDDFLTWYRSDSLRADVNFDGRVDSRDLQEMIVRFERQGG